MHTLCLLLLLLSRHLPYTPSVYEAQDYHSVYYTVFTTNMDNITD